MPETFLQEARPILKKVPVAEKYLRLCDRFREVISKGEYEYHSFPEFSYQAWKTSAEENQKSAKDEWIPVDYDPGLSAADWAALLADPQIFPMRMSIPCITGSMRREKAPGCGRHFIRMALWRSDGMKSMI